MSLFRPIRAPQPEATQQRSLQELMEFYGLEVATPAGVPVSEQSSLRLSTVYACVRLISESLASLPLQVFRRLDRGKQLLPKDDRYRLLHDAPNPVMTSFTFRETLAGHALLWGNGYAWIERAPRGKIVALWPVRPDKVKASQDKKTGELQYEYEFRGEKLKATSNSILHVPGLGFDGITGYSPIGLMKGGIGMGLAAENFGAQFFGNSALPSGILSTTKQLSPDAAARLKAAWQAMHGGDNRWKVAVLEEGFSWQQLGVKPNEAQYLETRAYQAAEIARAFRVPPWMVGIDTKGMTYSNVEHQMIHFERHTLRPWIVRLEQVLNAKLFPEPDLFAEFNADAMLRGDLKSRYEAYAIGHNRWLTTNEIREKENLNPVDGGDDMQTPAALPAPAEQDDDAPDADESQDEQADEETDAA